MSRIVHIRVVHHRAHGIDACGGVGRIDQLELHQPGLRLCHALQHLGGDDRRVKQAEQGVAALRRRHRFGASAIQRHIQQEARRAPRVLHQRDGATQRGFAGAHGPLGRGATHALGTHVQPLSPLVRCGRLDVLDDVEVGLRLVLQLADGELRCAVGPLGGDEFVNRVSLHTLNEAETSHAREVACQVARGDVGAEGGPVEPLVRRIQAGRTLQAVDGLAQPARNVVSDAVHAALEVELRLPQGLLALPHAGAHGDAQPEEEDTHRKGGAEAPRYAGPGHPPLPFLCTCKLQRPQIRGCPPPDCGQPDAPAKRGTAPD